MTELRVSGEADEAFLRARREAHSAGHTGIDYHKGLEAAAPFIVAPAYRDVADRLERGAYAANTASPVTVAVADGVQIAMALLRHLADELDGGAS